MCNSIIMITSVFILLTIIKSCNCAYPKTIDIGLYRHDNSYKGDALDGVPNGYGIEFYSNNCIYCGEFLNGKKVGYGIMHCPNEDTY